MSETKTPRTAAAQFQSERVTDYEIVPASDMRAFERVVNTAASMLGIDDAVIDDLNVSIAQLGAMIEQRIAKLQERTST